MIHENGEKAQRDRRKLAQKYDELCRFFKLKPLPSYELARLSNEQFYRLCEDTYERQPRARKQDYAEELGLMPRRKPRAFKWFLRDLLTVYRATGLRKAWLTLTAPFRYPAYLRRMDKRAAYEATARKLYPGMSTTDAVAALEKANADADEQFKIGRDTIDKIKINSTKDAVKIADMFARPGFAFSDEQKETIAKFVETEATAKSNRSEPDNYRDPVNQKPEAAE